MAEVVFTPAQTDAAQDLAEKLYKEWAAEKDLHARLLAPTFFLAMVAAVTAPDEVGALKLVNQIARHAVEHLKDSPA